jgi:hypothetical protein
MKWLLNMNNIWLGKECDSRLIILGSGQEGENSK